jgi:glutamine amidotransferase
MTETIAVIDYGMGNLHSVARAVAQVAPHSNTIITSSAADITRADRIVFPGQGAARQCVNGVVSHELVDVLIDAFNNKPFLGICMGLQILFDHSHENDGVDCLGLIAGGVHEFQRDASEPDKKIPHMGWNEVEQLTPHPLWQGIANNARFYFVHSYYVVPDDQSWAAASTRYLGAFTSAVARDNVFAVQFHPEKSAADGLKLLKNFSDWNVD